jgi:hypothetical protein
MNARRLGDALAILACVWALAVVVVAVASLLGLFSAMFGHSGVLEVLVIFIITSLPLGALWLWMIIACAGAMTGAGSPLTPWLVAMVVCPPSCLAYYFAVFRPGAARVPAQGGQVSIPSPAPSRPRPRWLSDAAAIVSGLIVVAFALLILPVSRLLEKTPPNINDFAWFGVLLVLMVVAQTGMWAWMLVDAVTAAGQNKSTYTIIWLVAVAVLQWVFTPTVWLYYLIRYRPRHAARV